jgi:hypothetical protein
LISTIFISSPFIGLFQYLQSLCQLVTRIHAPAPVLLSPSGDTFVSDSRYRILHQPGFEVEWQ